MTTTCGQTRDDPLQAYPLPITGPYRRDGRAEVIRASYAHLIVDEYQDCTVTQHRIVRALSQTLPTCVLGDPMQAIFGFAEPLADWARDICEHFVPAGELGTPWRWRNTGTEPLGHWLLDVRARLATGQAVDLRTAPPDVTWVQLRHAADPERRWRQRALKVQFGAVAS